MDTLSSKTVDALLEERFARAQEAHHQAVLARAALGGWIPFTDRDQVWSTVTTRQQRQIDAANDEVLRTEEALLAASDALLGAEPAD